MSGSMSVESVLSGLRGMVSALELNFALVPLFLMTTMIFVSNCPFPGAFCFVTAPPGNEQLDTKIMVVLLPGVPRFVFRHQYGNATLLPGRHPTDRQSIFHRCHAQLDPSDMTGAMSGHGWPDQTGINRARADMSSFWVRGVVAGDNFMT
jgi:hypothetical protein